MKISVNKITISNDETHHLFCDQPFYSKRFLQVLAFHHPGIAPVLDETGSYHIDMQGDAIYKQRYKRTFGFYNELAAVVDGISWHHINVVGKRIYKESYVWCGNFQNEVCAVRDDCDKYFHIDLKGKLLYQQKYLYVGDFKDGIAAVQNEEGLYTHIDLCGNIIHNKWFCDLDIFHKGFARAKDNEGWCHINKEGQPSYKERYDMIEPFYNGFSRVRNSKNQIFLIDEAGDVVKK